MNVERRRIVLADDHPLILHALRDLVEAQDEFTVVAMATDGATALELLRSADVDVAVIDVNMPGLGGLALLRNATREKLRARIVFLTASMTDEEVLESIAADVCGIVLKQSAPETLIGCLRHVASGGRWLPPEIVNAALLRETKRREDEQRLQQKLTPREIQIVRLAITGLPNKSIARRLNLSEGTVKLHLHNIYGKLGVSNRTELTAMAPSLFLPSEDDRP